MKKLPRNALKPAAQSRKLQDLVSVGPAMERDLREAGIRTVQQLARSRPEALYEKLSRLRHQRENVCVLDVFTAAIAQARNSALPAEKCQWWYWSRERLKKSAR